MQIIALHHMGPAMPSQAHTTSPHPSRDYEWVLEADIAACFDEIDHQALMAGSQRA